MSDQPPSPAVERVLPLLTARPAKPDVRHGYLDLLGDRPEQPAGPVQSFWESPLGSHLYDPAQALARRVLPSWYRLPTRARPPAGGRVLDVGCGPGNVTAQLGRAVGPAGLAIGVDISRPMLAQAARAQRAANVAFVRADARSLPFPDGTFDLVTSLASLQLVPAPESVLAAMARVLARGAWLAVMVPTPRDGLLHRGTRMFGLRTGMTFFSADELAGTLHAVGMRAVHTHRAGPLLWATARKPS
ncbi:methyltransferase [Saccharopolyspora subtropica]|uniref:Methyltransferase n=1 Tax=Saccharopolyspora thermophila TaxID=89367 RepID=A0A917K398_9PSEU|nr:methyltransferase domain-containing protein [Saccharopolyspora subtropica]GGI99491.1 methyltransferase [Saccharopolyspora subtropica]